MDATEYLMQSPANRMKISKAIENVERGENLISFETLEQAIQYAKEHTIEEVRQLLQKEMVEKGASAIITANGDGWEAHVMEHYAES